ncbi:hypothetical protein Pyn_18683 [Prunus yedoensis var. nudiflora]|uniref:Clathrin/coatomer adaptor adaptin-like N-terminal domain-containing protein n=1 Tax=Prunus yedoensis var. nudiflora TaxID=2094558 RepID=A0A314Y2I3_PRUYE|nr:hypothetical protein Pyn_18683 [Prunus yedoensis var. nudiflora]
MKFNKPINTPTKHQILIVIFLSLNGICLLQNQSKAHGRVFPHGKPLPAHTGGPDQSLRLQLIGESAFLSKAIDEIRREVKSTDSDTKANALQKLTYLSSLHSHDMSFAAFQSSAPLLLAFPTEDCLPRRLPLLHRRHARPRPHHQPAPQGPHSTNELEIAVKLVVVKIREMLVDDDPNLKYLALQALSVVAPKHLWAVLENKEVVIKSLSDVDPNIKLESLRLCMAMVSESNVAEICRVLVNYALKSDPEFCNEILGSILSTCGSNVYEIIIDFDWYVSLLGEMSRIPHCQKGEEIEKQLDDIGMRVKDIRPELVRVSRDLLIDPALLGNPFLHRILSAAAWLSGIYVEFSINPFELMEALLQPRTTLFAAI